MIKKIFFLVLLTIFIFNSDVYAKSVRGIIRNEVKPTIQAIKEQTKEQIRESLNQATNQAERNKIRNEIREKNKGLLDQIKNQIKEKLQNLKFSARIEGKITSLSNNLINIQDDNGKNYIVNITEKTQLRRRFWGKAELSEFAVGNRVKVIGRYTNEEKTIIEAVLIRNLSIQRRWGVFFGQVVTISENYLTLKTVNRGDLIVYLTNETRLKNRKGGTIKWSEIQIGHKIRVKGVWDRDLKEIRETEEVKDFSLPFLPTITKTE
ncbi:MAG: DUF5666 domain-containing protein [Patescibacteria group bacterium]|nr:DUF5666 domain-containing protein [Patescibacteria group bacterium]